VSYEVYLNAPAIRDLDHLTPEAERRAMVRIERLAQDPRPRGSVPLARRGPHVDPLTTRDSGRLAPEALPGERSATCPGTSTRAA
jgi:hypothetical protein